MSAGDIALLVFLYIIAAVGGIATLVCWGIVIYSCCSAYCCGDKEPAATDANAHVVREYTQPAEVRLDIVPPPKIEDLQETRPEGVEESRAEGEKPPGGV